MAKIKINLGTVLVVTLFILIAILRLWKAIDWFSFNFDEEYQAFLAWSQVLNPHAIWIGVSASNFGFYLGPAFTYLNAILFALSKGDLAILAVFSPLLGLLTTLSIFYVVSQIFSKKAGLYSSLIYGFSPLLNFFDRRFWNPTPIPFLTVWFLFSVYKAEKDTRWYILTAAIMATILHIHLSLVVLWPLVIYCLIKNFRKIKIKTWVFSVLVYLALVSPLTVFDITHNFDDLLGPIRFLLSPHKLQPANGLNTLSDSALMVWRALGRLLYLKQGTTIQDEMGLGVHFIFTTPHFLVSLLAGIPFLWMITRLRMEKKYIFLFVSSLLIVLAFLLYPVTGCEYFLLGFLTLYTVIIGIFLARSPTWIAYISILAMVLFTSMAVFTANQTKFGLSVRKELVRQIQAKVAGSEITVISKNVEGPAYPPHAGWCYLLRSMGTVPDSCPADESFGWIYPQEIRPNKPVYNVVISEDQNYAQMDKSSQILKRGAFTAEIIPLKGK